MGFHTGSYCKVWDIEPKSDTCTKVRLSISRKNKQSGEYEQEFSGFVLFIGSANAKKAACLNTGDSIKLGDVDVTTTYDAQTKKGYTNFKCFGFETDDNGSTKTSAAEKTTVDSGEIDDSRLPF